jgi:DNA-binding MurR/RpiR family transcriptional regulator
MPDAAIIKRLSEIYESLSPKLRKLAGYIISNHKDAAFLNSSALAKAAGVSEATVTRLAYTLDLRGYPELRDALQAHAKSVLSLPKYVPSSSGGFVLAEVAEMEKKCIDEMMETITPEIFGQAVALLSDARSVSVVGTHYNTMPASYAAYFLQAIRPSVHLLTRVDLALFTRIQECGASDVVLSLSTARYPKDTQRILPQFKKRGSKIIAITDSPVSPVISLADLVMIVPIRFLLSHVDPYAAIMVLIHSLVTAITNSNLKKAKQRIKVYHDFMDEYDYHTIKDIKLN